MVVEIGLSLLTRATESELSRKFKNLLTSLNFFSTALSNLIKALNATKLSFNIELSQLSVVV